SGISFAAANYRLSSEAKYPAQMHDSARAIQFIRSKAKEWNVDPSRIAAFGGSAGAGISLWLAFHDDMAKPDSEDPVQRQSTRLTCAIALQAQCTYDPREIKKIVPGRAYNEGALKQLYGLPPNWDWDTAKIDEALSARLKDASPITHLTKDDPPVFVYHRKAQETEGNIHHANFGRHLKKAMDELGIECIHKMDTDYENASAAYRDMFEFLKRQFGME
ncbi:MAG: alpha/beta hydrolase fold domain-containing protein, partial [Armatimonadota bacterium]